MSAVDNERTQDDIWIIKAHKPSLKERIFFFVSGVVVSVPITLFVKTAWENFMPVFTSFTFSVLFLAPLVEEFAKAYPLVYRHGETEKSLLLLGFLVGLGFGISEFILYVFVYNVSPLSRFSGVIFHSASTIITAYGIVRKHAFWYYSVAVGLHFTWNFLALFIPNWSVFFSPLLVFVSILLALSLYRKASEQFVTF